MIRKKVMVLVAMICLMVGAIPICVFADEVGEQNSETEILSTTNGGSTISVLNNSSAIDFEDSVGTKSNVKIDNAEEQNALNISVPDCNVSAFLVRSGSTTKVELYISYFGPLANKIKISSIKVQNVKQSTTYKTFKKNPYWYRFDSKISKKGSHKS